MAALWLPSDDRHTLALREPNLLVPGKKARGLVCLQDWVPQGSRINLLGINDIRAFGFEASYTAEGSPTHGVYSGEIGANFDGNDLYYDSNPDNPGTSDFTYFVDARFSTTGIFSYAYSETLNSGTTVGAIVGIYTNAATNNWRGVFRTNANAKSVDVGGPLHQTKRATAVLTRQGNTLYLCVNGQVASAALASGDSVSECNTVTVGGRRYQSANNFMQGEIFAAGFIKGGIGLARSIELSKNLYALLFESANSTPYLISVPTGGATVTLSSPTATATGPTTAAVGCTVTYT